eukprot:2484226-Pleurochrysis_carterae.AAC.4
MGDSAVAPYHQLKHHKGTIPTIRVPHEYPTSMPCAQHKKSMQHLTAVAAADAVVESRWPQRLRGQRPSRSAQVRTARGRRDQADSRQNRSRERTLPRKRGTRGDSTRRPGGRANCQRKPSDFEMNAKERERLDGDRDKRGSRSRTNLARWMGDTKGSGATRNKGRGTASNARERSGVEDEEKMDPRRTDGSGWAGMELGSRSAAA